MSRSRSIKPGFYLNEELAQCSLMARFIFPGLWMLADRSGRLEDRPLRIKAAILPYDNGDMNAMLDELQAAGMIVRYQHGNARYIQVLSFTKHQSPHVKEAQSTIPAPGIYLSQEEKPDASTVQAPDKYGASMELAPPDCLLLTPDCLVNPRETIVSLVANDVGNKVEKVPDCPQQQIVELFGELLPELPQPRAWEGQRANNLKARWRWVLTAKRPKSGERYATDAQTGIEFFRRMFGYVRESDFLMGRGKAGWLGCDLGWLVKAENFEKVLAGNYENREAAA